MNNTKNTLIGSQVDSQVTDKKIVWENHAYEFNDTFNQFKEVEEDAATENFLESEKDKYLSTFFEPEDPKPIMNTPIGTFEVDNSMNPYRHYKFYIGHTNFTIDNTARVQIKEADGIEVLKVISRYRFLIGVARLFDTVVVRKNLETILCGPKLEDLNKELDSTILRDGKTVKEIVDELKVHKFYALYIFPNLSYDFAVSDVENEEFIMRKNQMLEAQNYSSGIFLKNE